MIKATIRHLLDCSSADFALLSKADSETSDAYAAAVTARIDSLNRDNSSDLVERMETTLKKPFAQMSYTGRFRSLLDSDEWIVLEAVSILEKHASGAGFKFPVKWGLGLQRVC
jgi:hypothetical protein